MLRGVDISKWQSPDSINYKELAKHIDFAILRLGFTGHNNGRDPRNFNKDIHFNEHYRNLKAVGVPVGAYYYGGAKTYSEVDAELKIVEEMTKGKQFEFPIYYDVEENLTHGKLNKNDLTNIVINWCDKLERKGFFVGVYANVHWFNYKLDKKRLARFTTWLAHWYVTKPAWSVDMWQHTEIGKLPGHNGNLDINACYRDFAPIIKRMGLNGFSKGGAKPVKQNLNKHGQNIKIGDKIQFSVLYNNVLLKGRVFTPDELYFNEKRGDKKVGYGYVEEITNSGYKVKSKNGATIGYVSYINVY